MAEVSRIKVEITVEELDQAMAREHRPSKIRMLMIIRLVLLQPQPAALVAKAVGLSKGRTQHIIEDFNRVGLESFLDRNNPEFHRQHAFLTRDQEAALLESQRETAVKGKLINTRKIKAAFEQHLNREVSEMYICKVLKRHGWRKMDPRPFHPKRNLSIQQEFKETFAEKLQAAVDHHPLKERPILFMVQDESRFGRVSEIYRCWAPPGVRPEIPVQRVRQSFYLYGAFAPRTGQIEALILPHANTEMMSIFLEHVGSLHKDKLVVMMCDNAAWHRSHHLKKPENLMLLSMPPVSPELNPAEAMWDWIRENHFGNECFDHLDLAEAAIVEAFHQLDSHPEHVRSTTLVPYFSKAFQKIDPKYHFL